MSRVSEHMALSVANYTEKMAPEIGDALAARGAVVQRLDAAIEQLVASARRQPEYVALQQQLERAREWGGPGPGVDPETIVKASARDAVAAAVKQSRDELARLAAETKPLADRVQAAEADLLNMRADGTRSDPARQRSDDERSAERFVWDALRGMPTRDAYALCCERLKAGDYDFIEAIERMPAAFSPIAGPNGDTWRRLRLAVAPKAAIEAVNTMRRQLEARAYIEGAAARFINELAARFDLPAAD